MIHYEPQKALRKLVDTPFNVGRRYRPASIACAATVTTLLSAHPIHRRATLPLKLSEPKRLREKGSRDEGLLRTKH